MISAEAARIFMPSLSRPNLAASKAIMLISPARTIDGPAPDSSTYTGTSSKVIVIAVSLVTRQRRRTNKITPT
ncbi:hypothetical protein D3C74_498900 [compost metagenome]